MLRIDVISDHFSTQDQFEGLLHRHVDVVAAKLSIDIMTLDWMGAQQFAAGRPLINCAYSEALASWCVHQSP